MNNKITFPELVDRIAELTNTSKRVSELFLKELFGVIKERLEQGESVKIKNLGTFKVVEVAARKSVNVNTGAEMEIASHRKVAFTPDKSLAEAVNTPFEGFETIVLDDDITEEDIEDCAEGGVQKAECGMPKEELECDVQEDDEVFPPVFVEKKEDAAECEDTAELVVQNEVGEVDSTECRDKSAESEMQNEEFVDSEEQKDRSDDVSGEKRKSFIWGFIGGIVTFIVIGCIAIAVCDSCFGDFVPYSAEKENEMDVVVADNAIDTVNIMLDTIEQKNIEKPKKVVSKIVTDTVRVNYYLTKMSRKYYGRYEFWVYIYEENKDKIKNPNKVAPGLVVVIPPAEKYGIDKNSAESVDKANKLAENIR